MEDQNEILNLNGEESPNNKILYSGGLQYCNKSVLKTKTKDTFENEQMQSVPSEIKVSVHRREKSTDEERDSWKELSQEQRDSPLNYLPKQKIKKATT